MSYRDFDIYMVSTVGLRTTTRKLGGRRLAKAADLAGNLILAARICRSQRATLLRDLGLYAGQDSLLKNLAEKDGQSMSSLAANLGVRPPTVTKMVSRMAVQGFLRRQSSKLDNRQNHVFLTDAGQALLDEIDARWQQAASVTFSGLTEKDEKRLRKILGKIIADIAKAKNGQKNAVKPRTVA